jgi:hypothetical protein
MPRTFSGAQRTLMAGAEYELHVRVDVQNDQGAWQETDTLGGLNWFKRARWTDSIDSPAMEGTFSFIREHDDGTQLLSLAPYMYGSPLNALNGLYSPAINGGHGLQAFIQYTAKNVAPDETKWIEVFNGYIHNPSWGGEEGLVECMVRDIGGLLMAQWTEADADYSNDAGQPYETVMQAILDANPNIKLGVVTLYTPEPSGTNLRKFTLPKKPVLLALRDLAGEIGWDCKFRYDAAGQFRLTFFQPERDKTTPDYSLAQDEYFDIEAIEKPTDDVVNKLTVKGYDGTSGQPISVTVEDRASQLEFGVKYGEVSEDAASNLDSEGELGTLAVAMIADLSRPFATQRARLPFFWIAQTGDLIRFGANNVEYDDAIDLAVTQIDHALDDDDDSVLYCREQVAGYVSTWKDKLKPGTPLPTAAPTITARFTTDIDWLANVFVTPSSAGGEKVSVNYRDDGYYGLDMFLCVSSSDATRRFVDSGTELGPADYFTDGAGVFTPVLATLQLIPGRAVTQYFQAVGVRSALTSDWFALAMTYAAPTIQGASFNRVGGVPQFQVLVTAGQNMQSVKVELRSSATVGAGTLLASGTYDVASGATLTQLFTVTGIQYQQTWYAHLTPRALNTAGGILSAVGPRVVIALGNSYVAPTFADLDAQALVSTAAPNMPSARVIANSTTVAFDFTTAGVAQPYVPDLGITPAKLAAGGTTPTGLKFYRGDGTWQTVNASVQRVIQFPFGNGAVMGSLGDWLSAMPSFPFSALRWKARFLDAARAQVAASATLSVKKVRESDGALIDMVGGVLTLAAVAEASGSATGWSVPAGLENDEIIVTLESITPATAVSLLFILTVSDLS